MFSKRYLDWAVIHLYVLLMAKPDQGIVITADLIKAHPTPQDLERYHSQRSATHRIMVYQRTF